MKPVYGLGLESSCDETAVAVVRDGVSIESNIISSQIEIHREYFGVVPEIASRAHLEQVNALIDDALKESGRSLDEMSYVAVTNRPGLIGSLMITLQAAKVISYIKQIPLITINHLEAHLYAPFLAGAEISYPYLGLLISGGNTALYIVNGVGELEILGKTTDDAVGEAYDKISKYLNLGYPGGPVIDALAKEAVKKKISFPKILAADHAFRFSYSGLKTAVVNFVNENPGESPAEIAWAFQESATELLCRKTFAAAEQCGLSKIVVAGGVAANSRIRERFAARTDLNVFFAPPVLCTDNAAMVAGLGYHYFLKNEFSALDVEVFPKVKERVSDYGKRTE